MSGQEPNSGLKILEPVGQGDRVIEDGDSIDAIADEVGHFWKTIWDDPANADLKAARDSRNILLPGDKVTIPELREKQEQRETDLVHTFKRKGVPLIIRFEACDEKQKPYVGCDYTLQVGKRTYSGKTGPDGRVEHFVSPSAKEAVLTITVQSDAGGGLKQKKWILEIGGLRPANSVAGCQARLKNLGFEIESINGVFDSGTELAVRAFQRLYGLEETGKLDEATVSQIETEHRS